MFTLENDLVTCSLCGKTEMLSVAHMFTHNTRCKDKGKKYYAPKAKAVKVATVPTESAPKKAYWKSAGGSWKIACEGGLEGQIVKVYRKDGSFSEELLGSEFSQGLFFKGAPKEANWHETPEGKALTSQLLGWSEALNSDF